MSERNCLVLTQYREGDEYNDFIGKFYHFPASPKNYLKQFEHLPIEIVYYEPQKKGQGVFYGYGRIEKEPFVDKRDPNHFFVEISEYKPFSDPVNYKDAENKILEKVSNPDTYNSGNSVRKIKPDFLDDLCLDGGIQLNFKADAHLVQVLGEQLIASERVGILELVKNSFDAGAAYCNVTIENVPSLPKIPLSLYNFNEYEGPVIIIEDDGSGMSKEQIEQGWLRPASTLKTNIKEKLKLEKRKAVKENKQDIFENYLELIKVENKGRIPLGEKGVGRFATHRLGRNLIIKTKVAEKDFEYVLKINWDDFDLSGGHKDLESVKISLTRQELTRDYGVKNSGTQLIIYGGREGFELNEDEIKEINRTILKLNSPNPNPKSSIPPFKAKFICPQIKDLDEEITYQLYDSVFQISGIVDEWGSFLYDYSFTPPYNIPLEPFKDKDQTVDLKPLNKNYWQIVTEDNRKLWRKPACGSFYLHIDIWYRDKPWIGSSSSERDFKRYLERYGGISIYRDGVNVFTAENGTETDWLGLRQRQIKQAYRMSYYHMIGNIEIDQSVNNNLIDKTDREGMIKNLAFRDLTELTKSIVYFVENDYRAKRDANKELNGAITESPRKLGKYYNQSAKIISNISENYDVEADKLKIFDNISELRDKTERKGKLVELSKSLGNLENNLKQIQEVQDILTEQAGFGLGIAVALHEINKIASNFYYGILDLIKKGDLTDFNLEELKDSAKALESEILRLSPLRALRNEDPVTFRVSRSINYVHSVFKRRFKNLNIKFEYNSNADFEITARFGALNQILTNLIDNSTYWLDNPENVNKKIKLKIDPYNRTIVVADNGPGLHDIVLPQLFQPGTSLKTPKSGLGLYVCKHYMNLMKKRGDIYLANERDRIPDMGGAQFLLDFSRVIDKTDET